MTVLLRVCECSRSQMSTKYTLKDRVGRNRAKSSGLIFERESALCIFLVFSGVGTSVFPLRQCLYVIYASPVASAARIPACFCILNHGFAKKPLKKSVTVRKILTAWQVAGPLAVLGSILPRFQCTVGIGRALGKGRRAYLCAWQLCGLPWP